MHNQLKTSQPIAVAVRLPGLVVPGLAAPPRAGPSDQLKARVAEYYGKAALHFETRQNQAGARASLVSRGSGFAHALLRI